MKPEYTDNKLPMPDTHCWDDDEEKDVWSYSHKAMLEYGDKRAEEARTEIRDLLIDLGLSVNGTPLSEL